MSIYSWSYAPRENDLDPDATVMDHASSVRSLPSLQLDRGLNKDGSSGGEGRHSDEGETNAGVSGRGSDGEHWARITERPEEEDVANVDSREVTQEDIYIPHVPSPSPASELAREQPEHEEEEEEEEKEAEEKRLAEGEKTAEDERKSHSTPRSRSIALQTDSEVGSHRDITTAGRPEETPRRSGNDADDEDEGDEEEAEGKWPGGSGGKDGQHLDTLREESATLQSSRRPSSVSKDDISRSVSTSKDASALGTRGKAGSAQGESAAVSVAGEGKGTESATLSKSPVKSSAASRTSVRKSEEETAGRKASAADSKKRSGAPSRASEAPSAVGKGKAAQGVAPGERSQTSSATPGRHGTSQSGASPTKSGAAGGGSRATGKKPGDKSVSGHSSKRSSAAKKNQEGPPTEAGDKKATPTGPESDDPKEVVDIPWADEDNENDEDALGDDLGENGADIEGKGGAVEDTDIFRNRSTPSEGNARLSGEDSGGGRNEVDLGLSIQGEQLFTPPETPGVAKRKSVPGSYGAERIRAPESTSSGHVILASVHRIAHRAAACFFIT
ncbi:hypothetical protein PoB_005890300 [Plakobranchus ocellatus]|uniref:Uncharacterized protein n=1 Tax=Plakobranchus ocellatus TaxID=259542 RepID=A0AAV4CMA3_9GAST|nr:hypothetical protein PoB_005890300 [Plakobranchus ocellatus]